MISKLDLVAKRFVILLVAAVMAFLPAIDAMAISDEHYEKNATNHIWILDQDACPDGSSMSGSSSGNAAVSGSAVMEKVWTGLKSLKYTDEVAAGIMGNMNQESGFNPARYEDKYKDNWESGFDWETDTSSGYGVGLAQWSGERRVKFFEWMRTKNDSLVEKYLKRPSTYGGLSGENFIREAESEADVDALISLELSFMDEEIKSDSSYGEVLKQTTAEDAAVTFATNFEKCTSCSKTSDNTKARRDKADEIYKMYSGKTSFGATSTAVTIDGSQITVIGDSITNSSYTRNAYNSKLSGVDIYAEDSKHFASGDSGGDTGLEILSDLVKQGKLRDVLVFALGTNDTLNKANIDELLSTAKDASRIVLVTNYDNGVVTGNNKLFTDAVSADDRVVVADWADLVDDHPENYLSDGTHPANQEAGDAYVDLIVKALGGGATGSSATQNIPEECCDPSASPDVNGAVYNGAKYNITGTLLNQIAAMANAEQDSVNGVKFEASIMANLFESHGGKQGDVDGLVDYITTPPGPPSYGWFAQRSIDAFYSGASFSEQDKIDAVKSVLVDGYRTIPPEIVEHDCIKCTNDNDYDIVSWSNDGVNFSGDFSNAANDFKRGVTVLRHRGYPSASDWIFWEWADPDNKTGDPFGYYPDRAPSQSAVQATKGTSASTISGSSVTWTNDGWIQAGIDGYVMDFLGDLTLDSTWGKDFSTSSLNGVGSGPNKITLHATESPGTGAESVKSIYESQVRWVGVAVPPHFTIDIKNRKIYQHQSIRYASSSIEGTDTGDLAAGIQIEIIGYDNSNEDGYSESWDLANETSFSDDDFAYLAELLNAISVQTGIPLTSSVDWSKMEAMDGEAFKSYTGILGHKHVPKNTESHSDLDNPAIWGRIEKAISNFTGAQQKNQCAATPDIASLQNLVKEWVWKENESGWNTTTKKSAYDAVIQKRSSNGQYVGDSCYDGGVDCGGFVTTLMQESGWDTGYNPAKGNTSKQYAYLSSPNKWVEVTSSIHSNKDAQPGDVLIKPAEDGTSWHHTLVYVGNISGFSSPLVEAGQCQYAPMESQHKDIMWWVQDQKFHVFRNTEPPMTGGNSVGEEGLTYEQAVQFMKYYGANKNNSSLNATGEGSWYISGCNGNNKALKLGGSNCVTFSLFFINKFAGFNASSIGNGKDVVGNLASNFKVSTGSQPQVWSVFSWQTSSTDKFGHTGVILGHHDGQWIVGHASCSNTGVGVGDGKSFDINGYKVGSNPGSGFVIMDADIVKALNGVQASGYAYLKDRVDTAAISNYLNTGT